MTRPPAPRRSVSALLHLGAAAMLVVGTFRPASAQALPARKDPTTARSSAPNDSTAVLRVVSRFHDALSSGDSATVLSLLAADAVVLESGDIESRTEYRAHHLPADIEFARAVSAKRAVRTVSVAGDAAWVASTSTSQGEFRGHAINSVGAELMVLRRAGAGWRIAAIHWSSHSRRGG